MSTYPPVRFSPVLSANIAFSSLPEGVTSTTGALAYSWRVPIPLGDDLELGRVHSGNEGGDLKEGDGFLHGYVHFVQEKVRIEETLGGVSAD